MAESDAVTSPEKTRTILIAMDGSKHAIQAFEWYAEHMHRDTDNVLMAHCAEMSLHLPSSAYLGSPATVHALLQKHEDHIKEIFKTIDDVAKKYKIEHKLVHIDSSHHKPGEAIVNAADQQNVDFIILGSRGHNKLRRTIMGSVSDYILHHSHVPVLICKHAHEHHS
ncbi:hypothetical protein ACF0H5_004134 [Mactra antiquata]